jgi:hypothetical protein
MKNYVFFVNDHSGSMSSKAHSAMADYNAHIKAVRESATAEMQDTVVSVFGVGMAHGAVSGRQGHGVKRQITISNPHVLQPITYWPVMGGSPLFDGIGMAIEFAQSLPDINDPNVSVLIMTTTDGEEEHSEVFQTEKLRTLIQKATATGRFTLTFRIPKNNTRGRNTILNLGISVDNISEWDNSASGLAASTQASTQAVSNYYRSRSTGLKSSSSFYANASAVNLAVLEDISKKVSLYVVPQEDNGIEIRPFILRHRMDYLKGAAFYQLSKTEAKVSHSKQVLVREQTTGKIYAGAQARGMIGLPTNANARVHPGDHKNFDIFIQSESVNRKLVGGSGVVYWKEIGVPFTAADLAYLQPKAPVAAVPAVPKLIPVPVSTTPTKSPIPVTPMFVYFETREEARQFCGAEGVVQSAILKNPLAPKSRKWSLPTALLKKVGAQPVKAMAA